MGDYEIGYNDCLAEVQVWLARYEKEKISLDDLLKQLHNIETLETD